MTNRSNPPMENSDKEEPTETMDNNSAGVDGGWGWLVVFAVFVFNIITVGCSYSGTALFIFLVDNFQESRTNTAWIISVCNLVPLLCGPISSVVIKNVGFRNATIIGGCITFVGFIASVFMNSITGIAIAYGGIAGFGISLPYLASKSVVCLYFEKRRALATGIAACGASIAAFIVPPFYKHLILIYGWRGAILIMGGISLKIVVCGAIFRPLNNKKSKQKESRRSDLLEVTEVLPDVVDSPASSELIPLESHLLTDASEPDIEFGNAENCNEFQNIEPSSKYRCCKIIRKHSIFSNKRFVVLIISTFIGYFWYDVPYVYNVDRVNLFGFTASMAALVVAVIRILRTVGYLLYGFVGDLKQVNRTYLYGASMILIGIVISVMRLFTTNIPYMLLAGAYGLISASAEALTAVIVVDILGKEKIGDAYGCVMFLQGVAKLVGKLIADWQYDISGSYDNTWYSAGSCLAIAGIIMFIPVQYIRRSSNK